MAKLDSSKQKKRNIDKSDESKPEEISISSKPHKKSKKSHVEITTDENSNANFDENVTEKKTPKKRKHSKSKSETNGESNNDSQEHDESIEPLDGSQISEESDDIPKTKKPKKLSVVDTVKERNKNKKSKQENTPCEVIHKVFVAKLTMEEVFEKYPILKDEELVKKYLAVPMTNNQKGRLRQQLVNSYKSTDIERVPDAINMKLEELTSKSELADSDYRKIRILHNMLKTNAMKLVKSDEAGEPLKKKKGNKKPKPANMENAERSSDDQEAATQEESDEIKQEKSDENSEKSKVKGPKRYVVFVGNLPYEADKDSIMRHFSNVVNKIKDVRIPKKDEEKKGGIAYIELADEPSYEMALSKHHSMFQNRRINVLYTTTGKSKIDKKEAKGKRAKLLALQKTGRLLGSAPASSKRSARRKKQKQAVAQQ